MTASDLRRLRKLRKSCSDSRVLRRIVTLLMLAEGFLVRAVCQATGLSRRAVETIRARWDRFRFDSLHDKPRSGRPPVAVPAYRRRVIRTVQTSPLKFGYVFTVWSTARLAEHLRERTGIPMSPRQIRRILRDEGFSFGIPAHTLRGKRNEREHRRKQKRLQRLKKGPCRPILAIGFVSRMKPASTSSLT